MTIKLRTTASATITVPNSAVIAWATEREGCTVAPLEARNCGCEMSEGYTPVEYLLHYVGGKLRKGYLEMSANQMAEVLYRLEGYL